MKATKALLLALLVTASLFLVNCSPVRASGLIFIKADGSIEGTNKIYRTGNVYTFASDIKDSYGIIVEKANIVIDGAGHTLQATPNILPIGSWDYGIEVSNITNANATIKNLKIKGFNVGIFLWTPDNTITGNVIMDSNVGIFLAESPNTIVGNCIENNGEGIFLGPLSSNHEISHNLIYHNSFVNNTRQVYDCECTDPSTIQHLNTWDNGIEGNYWSNYNGTDNNNDEIGDIPYLVSDDDVDKCPLMKPLIIPLAERHGFLGTNLPLEHALFLIAVIAVAIATITGYLFIKRRRPAKTSQSGINRALSSLGTDESPLLIVPQRFNSLPELLIIFSWRCWK